jgi:hypothetical protein
MRFIARVLLAGGALPLANCAPGTSLMNQIELTAFATRMRPPEQPRTGESRGLL